MAELDAISHAVLYEGYLLWPYRRSAMKNRQRWTIGSLAPAGSDPSLAAEATARVLLETGGRTPEVAVAARFLHLVHRQVEHQGAAVDEVRIDGRLHQSWEEATEREITFRHRIGDAAVERPFTVEAGEAVEQVAGAPETVLRRRWHRLDGTIHTTSEPVGEGVWRLTVRLRNTTAPGGDVQELGFASAHIALRTADGGFVSAIDPPEPLRVAVREHPSDGLFPVLIGDPGSTTAVLAAPIALYDWPQVSPESPGDLFDATEIDRMLVLNVLSMTPQEQDEMAAADPKAAEILRRCAELSTEDLLRLHGVLRDVAKEVW